MQEIDTPGSYEFIIILTFRLFLKSMLLYNQVGDQVTKDPKIIKNAAIQNTLAQIIETIVTCGSELQCLPDPPHGAEIADQQFHELGKDIRTFARLLKDLSDGSKKKNKQEFIQEVWDQKEKVKHDFHEAINSFEHVYPGRLTKALQSLPLKDQKDDQ